ncbi:NAD(P)/FAD-dependent oxidoreductase [Xinfangfangia pollutisoli]|uniref:NAD(P)/FAD-dependent oxidoreductase n=1 Tax=Xinfangfangia pollutisoli TaxID=2865960 RepID=UPI001CD3538F|nr:FAD-binding oxidoreductase [Xinfangfangia pollutisoli]
MASVDVTVRGGGIFGLAVAWACARRGARVRLIETARIGAGASGGLVGALAPFAPEGWNALKAFQLDSLLMAEAWWGAVAAAGGVDPLYRRSGRLQPLADAAAVAAARQRADAARDLWQGRAEWRVVAAAGAAWEPASPTGLLVEDTLTARLSPRAAGAALVAALRAAGAEIVIGDAPEDGAVVHATGAAGLADLSADFGRKLGAGVKGQAVLLRHDAAALPQIYAGGLHVVPHGDGTVAIGSTSETDWQVAGPDEQAEALVARARAVMPALAAAPVLERWAGVRPRAKSRGPVLGAWPGRPGHFVANGGFKIGFGLAPKAAEGMADLILNGNFDIPDRFSVEALLG